MKRRVWGGLLVAAMAVSGCHWVFSYSSAADGPGRDVADGPARRDRVDVMRGEQALDVPLRGDTGPRDVVVDRLNDRSALDQSMVAGSVIWKKLFGSPAADQGLAIAIDGAENVYVVGSYGDAMALGAPCAKLPAPAPAGTSDAFVVSFSTDGVCRWATPIITPGNDVGHGVAVSGGVVFVVGSSTSNTVFLATFEAATGKANWQHPIIASGAAGGTAVAVDSQSNVYLTGYYSVAITMPGGGPALSGFGNHDVFVASFSSTGALRWSKSFGGPGNDQGRSIAVGAGRVVVTGYYAGKIESFTPTILASKGLQDVFVVGYDSSNGVYDASKPALSLGGPGNDQGLGVVLDASGHPVVVGSFEQTMTSLTSKGKTDLFVRSWASPTTWAISCGTTEADGAVAVGMDATGASFVVGQFGAAGLGCGLALPHAGLADLLIGRWSAAGASGGGWPVAFGGLGDDLGNGIAVGKSALYVVGTTTSSMLFGQPIPPGTGDVFVAKIKR